MKKVIFRKNWNGFGNNKQTLFHTNRVRAKKKDAVDFRTVALFLAIFFAYCVLTEWSLIRAFELFVKKLELSITNLFAAFVRLSPHRSRPFWWCFLTSCCIELTFRSGQQWHEHTEAQWLCGDRPFGVGALCGVIMKAGIFLSVWLGIETPLSMPISKLTDIGWSRLYAHGSQCLHWWF